MYMRVCVYMYMYIYIYIISIVQIFENWKYKLLMIGVKSENSIFLSLFTEEKENELKCTGCSWKETWFTCPTRGAISNKIIQTLASTESALWCFCHLKGVKEKPHSPGMRERSHAGCRIENGRYFHLPKSQSCTHTSKEWPHVAQEGEQ